MRIRILAFVLAVSITSSSVVLADGRDRREGDGKKAAWIAGGLILLSLLSKDQPSQSYTPAPQGYRPTMAPSVQPQRAGNLGTIRVEAGSIGWGGNISPVELMAKACSRVGFQPIDEQARRIAEEEAQRFGGTASLRPADWIGIVSVSQGDGYGAQRNESYRYGSSSDSVQEVWARVSFRVYREGVQVAEATAEANDSMSSSSQSSYNRWGGGYQTADQQPSRPDLAVEAACQMAANGAAQQMATQRYSAPAVQTPSSLNPQVPLATSSPASQDPLERRGADEFIIR